MALDEKLRDLIKKFGLHALILFCSASSAVFLLRFSSSAFFFLQPLLISTAVSLAAIWILHFLSPSDRGDQSDHLAEDFLHFVSEHSPDGAANLPSVAIGGEGEVEEKK